MGSQLTRSVEASMITDCPAGPVTLKPTWPPLKSKFGPEDVIARSARLATPAAVRLFMLPINAATSRIFQKIFRNLLNETNETSRCDIDRLVTLKSEVMSNCADALFGF